MHSFTFSTALVRFYLRGHISVDQSLAHVQLPKSLLGLIPLGVHKEAIPLKNISGVARTFDIKGKLCLFGLGLVAIGLFAKQFLPSTVVQSFSTELGIALKLSVVLGVVSVLASLRHVIAIGAAGRYIAWPLPFYEGKKARDIEKVLSSRLYDDADKTDLGLHGFPQAGSTRPPEFGQP